MAARSSRVMTAKHSTTLYLLQFTLLMQVCELPGVYTGPVVIFEGDSPDVKWGNVADELWPARAALYRQLMTSQEKLQSRYQISYDLEQPGGGVVEEGADAEGVADVPGPAAVSPDTELGGGAGRQKAPPPPPSATSGVVSWRDTGAVWWADWQLPVFVVLFTVVGVLAITFVVLLWLKNQMVSAGKQPSPSGEPGLCSPPPSPSPPPPVGLPPRTDPPPQQWIVHPAMRPPLETLDAANIQPQLGSVLPEVMTRRCVGSDDARRPEPVRIRAKGLLERRGSSASLTIELVPSSGHDAAPAGGVVTPTRECASEEYLLSAGNVLSRSELRNCLRDVRPLHREFWDLPSNHPEGSTAVAGCGTKNRYRTILPNERSRVRLRCHPDADSQSEYINANYVRGYDGEERAYIATQGPLPHTVGDFWSLVWQEEVSAIVMITRLCEQGRPKCERYLPAEPGETERFGDVEVTLDEVVPREHCTLRRLAIRSCGGQETRVLSHFWYDSWPDHKTPAGPRDLVTLAREVEELRRLERCGGPDGGRRQGGGGPVLVHCSAGIGRTGCFIAVSVGIRQLLEEDNVDILGIVCQMRYDRGGMIQTAEQYEFVHRALCLFEQSLPASE